MPSRKVSGLKPPDVLSIPINIDLLSGSLLHSQFDSTFKQLSELFFVVFVVVWSYTECMHSAKRIFHTLTTLPIFSAKLTSFSGALHVVK